MYSLIACTDLIDIVKEQLYGHDYEESEDPSLYISTKTKRGPLSESWLDDYWNEVNNGSLVFVYFIYHFMSLFNDLQTLNNVCL